MSLSLRRAQRELLPRSCDRGNGDTRGTKYSRTLYAGTASLDVLHLPLLQDDKYSKFETVKLKILRKATRSFTLPPGLRYYIYVRPQLIEVDVTTNLGLAQDFDAERIAQRVYSDQRRITYEGL